MNNQHFAIKTLFWMVLAVITVKKRDTLNRLIFYYHFINRLHLSFFLAFIFIIIFLF